MLCSDEPSGCRLTHAHAIGDASSAQRVSTEDGAFRREVHAPERAYIVPQDPPWFNAELDLANFTPHWRCTTQLEMLRGSVQYVV